MKKYVLKATALAIGALVGGSAVAAVTTTVDLNDASTAATFAKELSYVTATPLNPTTAVNTLNFTTKLGFGVAAATTRYIRVDFGNATLNASLGSAIGTDIDVGTLSAGNSSVAISAGGTAGDNYVIFAVAVAGSDTSQASTVNVNVKVPSLRVVSTGSPVTVTYSLHETGTSAVAGAATGNAVLASKSGATLVKFATGLSFTNAGSSTLKATANVEESFKKFKSGTTGYIGATTAKLGEITLAATSVLEHDGSTVELADLLAAGTKVVLTGDTSIPFGSTDADKKNSVFISSDANCGGLGTVADAVPTGTGASFTVGSTAITSKGVCYVVNGTGEIAAGTYSLGLTVAAAAGTTTGNVAAVSVAEFDRDGTELTAPFGSINANHTTRLILTSKHGAAAKVELTAITASGFTCGTSLLTEAQRTIPANGLLQIMVKDFCPTLSNGTTTDTKLGLRLTIAAPKSKIEGVMQQYRNADASTGNISADHSSYVLSRPAQ